MLCVLFAMLLLYLLYRTSIIILFLFPMQISVKLWQTVHHTNTHSYSETIRMIRKNHLHLKNYFGTKREVFFAQDTKVQLTYQRLIYWLSRMAPVVNG